MTQLPSLDRFPYSSLRSRPDFDWPDGKRLAVNVSINLEHFVFGEGGVDLDRPTPAPNHRSYLWREYGNRVGVWRLLDLFDELEIPIGVITNTAVYDHCPETLAAFSARGDEIIGHGDTNSKKPSEMTEAEETAMVRSVTDIITKQEGAAPTGWLSPYVTPSTVTSDILKEAGYEYVLDWGLCDDQPFWARTRSGPILAVPYPLELNDQPAMVFRRTTAPEFADMMMIVGKKVEELIARIAQKARAAGIHLVLATQRPSVDVITGLIKANIPTRMAFQVSSKIDSRTILDQQGAENLLGMGDMLYLPPGTSVPERVHGAFVDDHEVHAVVNDWKARAKPNYIDEILNGDATEDILLPGEASENADEESDPLYDEAVSFVIETGKVSVSSVQRKLRVGYNRAARLVEQMETSGIVSSPGHNGARDVLVPNGANS